MKKLMVLLLAGCLGVLSPGFSKVTADDDLTGFIDGGQIPLSRLAGTYAATLHGSLALCLENTPPHAPAACGSPTSIVVPLTLQDVGAQTRDAEGNGCGTITETEANFPLDVSPPAVFVDHVVTKDTHYDPTLGTGDGDFTSYFGGQCHGATFDRTGATLAATGTYHYAASNRGRRIDVVLTSAISPVGAIGDFSLSGTNLRH